MENTQEEKQYSLADILTLITLSPSGTKRKGLSEEENALVDRTTNPPSKKEWFGRYNKTHLINRIIHRELSKLTDDERDLLMTRVRIQCMWVLAPDNFMLVLTENPNYVEVFLSVAGNEWKEAGLREVRELEGAIASVLEGRWNPRVLGTIQMAELGLSWDLENVTVGLPWKLSSAKGTQGSVRLLGLEDLFIECDEHWLPEGLHKDIMVELGIGQRTFRGGLVVEVYGMPRKQDGPAFGFTYAESKFPKL